MTNVQLFTLCFTLPLIILMLIFYKQIRRILNTNFKIWIYFIFSFIFLLAVRFIPYWYVSFSNYNDFYMNYKWQNIFMTDICAAFGFLLHLCMVLRLKFIAKAITPICFMGGIITIFGEMGGAWETAQDNLMFSIVWKYSISNNDGNGLYGYYSLHFMEIISSLIIFIVYSKHTVKEMITGAIMFIFYLIYAYIIKLIFNLQWNISGLVEYDWINEYGEYHNAYLLVSGIGWSPEAIIISFGIFMVIIYFIISLIWIYYPVIFVLLITKITKPGKNDSTLKQ